MEIKMWGGQSQVEKLRNDLIKELNELDKAILVLSSNDVLRYDDVKIIGSLEQVVFTGNFVILSKDGYKLGYVDKKYESLFTLYNVPKVA